MQTRGPCRSMAAQVSKKFGSLLRWAMQILEPREQTDRCITLYQLSGQKRHFSEVTTLPTVATHYFYTSTKENKDTTCHLSVSVHH